MQNGFPSASKKLLPRPGENGDCQDCAAFQTFSTLATQKACRMKCLTQSWKNLTWIEWLVCWVWLAKPFNIGSRKKEHKGWELIPWSGSLHLSHFGKLSCCKALDVYKDYQESCQSLHSRVLVSLKSDWSTWSLTHREMSLPPLWTFSPQ